MEIDNFDILMQHIDFVDSNDRYIVHIMRRPKDCKELTNNLGANEAQRLIRTYYIDNLDYMKAKIPAMKELCKSCNARAYLIVSPKDNFDCLMNLAQKTLDTIRNKNYTVKPEHLLRQAYCENHKSRNKQWVLDLDNDEMIEYYADKNGKPTGSKTWTASDVMTIVQDELKACNKDPALAYAIPTRNGIHIITPPFNLQSANKRCGMIFEGCKKFPVELNWTSLETYEIKHKQVTGWLHKDGMTLLFCPIVNNNV